MARLIDFLNEDPNFTIFYFLAEIYGLLCNVGGKTLISSSGEQRFPSNT